MFSDRPTFAAAEFRKARKSNPDRDCVEVARRGSWVELRDDKKTFGAADDYRLVVTAAQFDDFLDGVKLGEFTGRCIDIIQRHDGVHVFRSTVAQPDDVMGELEFTPREFQAFCSGVAAGEFTAAAFDEHAA